VSPITEDNRVVALVPAHNEEVGIEGTLRSLLQQTHALTKIIVICDNCTDRTREIALNLGNQYSQIESYETVDNKARKSGALNFGYSLLETMNVDYVLEMDADTVLAPNIVEKGLQEYENSPLQTRQPLGGVCSRFLVAKPIGKMHLLGKFLWHLQNIEYGFADADRIMSIKEDARVLSGTCTIFKYSVLKEVGKLRARTHQGYLQIWNESSIVEDFALTLDIKSLGYATRCSWNMVNLTNVPESFWEYCRQRIRWYSGTIDELRLHGIKQYTVPDILTHTFGILMTITRVIFYFLLYTLLIHKTTITPNILTYIVPVVVYLYNIYRFSYIRVNRHWGQAILVFSLVPLELYAVLREVLMLISYYLSFFNKSRKW